MMKKLLFFVFLLCVSSLAFANVIIYSPTTAVPVQKNPGEAVTVSFSYTDTFACGYDLNIFLNSSPATNIGNKHVEGSLCATTVENTYYGPVITCNCNRTVSDIVGISTGALPGDYTVKATLYSMNACGACNPAQIIAVSASEPSAVKIAVSQEICGNSIDDNNNSLIDENCLEICGNSIDDNNNGQIDENCAEINILVDSLAVNGQNIPANGNTEIKAATVFYQLSIKNSGNLATSGTFRASLHKSDCNSVSEANKIAVSVLPDLNAGGSALVSFSKEIDWNGLQQFCFMVKSDSEPVPANPNRFFAFSLLTSSQDMLYSFNPFVVGEKILAGASNPDGTKSFSFSLNSSPIQQSERTIDNVPAYNLDIFEMPQVQSLGDYNLSATANNFLGRHSFGALDKLAMAKINGMDVPVEYSLANDLTVKWWIEPYYLKLLNFKRINNLSGLFFEVMQSR